MTDKKSEEMIGKLGKVADSLETATTQLTNVVTQQQLDVARERISKCEADTQGLKSQLENFITNKDESFDDLTDSFEKSSQAAKGLEKDFSGMRSLVLSSFALSVICLIGLILCITKL
jgi:flagellar biosynthesis chaperone FliJ